jgi:hypothetical protein
MKLEALVVLKYLKATTNYCVFEPETYVLADDPKHEPDDYVSSNSLIFVLQRQRL